ncbi:MAG: DUF167 domain-containing protein [Thermoguttaceae bacterium]
MIELRPRGEGVVLPVQAQPAARRSEVCGVQNGRLKVCTTQAPEKGKANAALMKLLAKRLGLRRSQLTLVSGETSPRKEFLVSGVDAAELNRRIEAVT